MADEELPVIARFEVRRRSYLAPDGTVLRPLPNFASDSDILISLYRGMVLTRAFDLKAVSLQRTGQLGTYAVSLGQEAVSVGIASAMREEDVVLPSYRDNGTLLWRGTKMEEILLFWGGDRRGNLSSGSADDFPYCIPVASQAPHAAGVAYAFKLRKEPRVAVCLFGDGATSKGDVWEAMNFAGVHKLPVVFVANNNQWAISVPLQLQTASQTLAQKAIARELMPASGRSSAEAPMPEVTLVEAINLALARAMEEDANVVVLGEDVGVNGGVFRATVGLQQRFGAERVIDTPLAELLISGLCVGMAAPSLKPLGEIQFIGVIYPFIDQLVDHASRMRQPNQGPPSWPLVPR